MSVCLCVSGACMHELRCRKQGPHHAEAALGGAGVSDVKLPLDIHGYCVNSV